MGVDNVKKACLFSFKLDLNNKIEEITEENQQNNEEEVIKQVIDIIVSFLMSEDFIAFYLTDKENFLFNIFRACGDYLLFIKILIPLLEELKNKKFETQLWKGNQFKKEKEKGEYLLSYYNNNKEKIDKNANDKAIISSEIKTSDKLLKIYGKFFKAVVNLIFERDESKIYSFSNLFDYSAETIYTLVEEYKSEEVIKLRNYLLQLEDNLKFTNDLYNMILFMIDSNINKEKLDEINEHYNPHKTLKNLDKYLDSKKFDFKKNYCSIFFEENTNSKNEKNHSTYFSFGEKLSKKQRAIDMLEITYKINDNGLLNGKIAKSILTYTEFIVIKLDIDYLKKYKIILEDLNNEINKKINELKEKNESSKNLDSFILIHEKIIAYPQSYNLLLNELEEQQLFPKEEIEEAKKHYENNKIKSLEEKVKNLENKLKEEKIQKHKLEDTISKLKIELNKNDKIEFEKMAKKYSNLETKDELLKIIFEKEKEIKELKLKLSRYPLELNDGEKLIAIIIRSRDKQIYQVFMCKNTEKFNSVAKRLYENYPKCQKKENFFTCNGFKIDKNKTLDENKIHSNDEVIVNIVD